MRSAEGTDAGRIGLPTGGYQTGPQQIFPQFFSYLVPRMHRRGLKG